jgi:phosphatidyl-myo-inositol alpha-mannosyltransferase
MSIRRVALLSPYALSLFGGVQEQVLAMSRVLRARGIEVLIVAPDSRDTQHYDTPATVLRFGIRVAVPANGSRAPLTLSPRASRQARDAIERFSPDVVHFHEPFAPLLGYATLMAHRRPALGTFHRSGDGPALRAGRLVLGRLASRLDGAVAVSESAAATLLSTWGLRSDVLFNGFETERFVLTPRVREETTTLLFVGRLEARKGAATAITAVREHNARHGRTPWRLIVAGDGPERARLEALAAHSPAIVFLGRVSDEEKRGWLRRAHALITPSTHGESFGLVLLEGMASGTAVVASDIAGYRDAAGGHATLFHPGDPRSLERAIEDALAGESTSGIDDARRYAEGWSMSTLIDQYLEHYETAIRHFETTQ